MQTQPKLAIIGGSGFYRMPGLEDVTVMDVSTPFGKPSAPIVVGTLEGNRVAFLARHGEGHALTPSEINYRANIYGLKSIGVERIVSVSACGSLRDDYMPGQIVIPDQLVDFTRGRQSSFFGDGIVVHVSVAEPFCTDLSRRLVRSLEPTDAEVHSNGVFVTIEGPRFSTRAESNVYRSLGISIIGMTTSPEAFLAREAEMCYAVMAHVTDYDVWHVSERPVSVEMVVEVLNRNTGLAQEAVRNLVHIWNSDRDCSCGSALADALITERSVIPVETRQQLDLLIGKYL